ncbi:hypothetical protein [Lysobacter enzymogenes]
MEPEGPPTTAGRQRDDAAAEKSLWEGLQP